MTSPNNTMMTNRDPAPLSAMEKLGPFVHAPSLFPVAVAYLRRSL
jgi:hypothetical protein